MNKILLMVTVFSLGYVANDVVKEINVNPIGNVNADGHGYLLYELDKQREKESKKNDKEFVRRVQEIVEDCMITGVVISC